MTEVFKNIALAAGATYLVYRVYTSCVLIIRSLWRGRSEPGETDQEQMEARRGFQDVA